jgi:hypothetical protein
MGRAHLQEYKSLMNFLVAEVVQSGQEGYFIRQDV